MTTGLERLRVRFRPYRRELRLWPEPSRQRTSRAPYHYHLGLALIRNPRTRRDAEVHLSRAAELEPYNAQIRVKLGILYKEAGLSKTAEHFFREAIQMDPENKVAMRELSSEAAKSKGASGGGMWKSDIGSMAKKI